MLSPTMAPLASMNRWLLWSLQPDPHRPDKPRKVPLSPRSGSLCSATDPNAWCTYEEARAAQTRFGAYGVAYCFNEGDGLWFLDIDNCWDAAAGQWSPVAQNMLNLFAGKAAVEVSQSGRGLHLFGFASSIPVHACKNIPLGIELYHHQRFVALTDHNSVGIVGPDTSAELAGIVAAYFPKTAQSSDVVDWTDEGDGATADDEELLRIMLMSGQTTAKALFNPGSHVPFAALWEADADVLGRVWPDTGGQGRGWDGSQADSALAAHLVYWCGGNCARIERFMQASALKREKWERADYLPRTIINACATVKNRAGPREVGTALMATVSAEGTPEAADRAGVPYLSFEEHKRLFEGCVWVQGPNKIWVPHDGKLLDKPRFDIAYGGRTFVLRQDGKATQSAWEAFTMNQGYSPPAAADTCFRPYMKPGQITNDNLVNTYFPIETPRTEGDAGRIGRHIMKMLPAGVDAQILISYMARVVRSPGFKSQWWPVIQGCEGNGKSILNIIMQFCIGQRYSHQARASALAKTGMQFNSWVTGKLYLGLEEIHVGDRRDFLNDIKDIVTNATVSIEAKGVDQTTGDNFLNGLALTNYVDAMPIDLEARRWCVFYCAQQKAVDLIRDGMRGDYFADIYDWLYGRGRYADFGENYGLRVCNFWLRDQVIIEEQFDPMGMNQRAPETSSTPAVLAESRGHVEQEILEMAARGTIGFAGGWLSSLAVDALLRELRVRISHTKRGRLLENLGYWPHPALEGGRAPRAPSNGGSRPVLYVTHGHPSLHLADPEAVMRAFELTQSGTGGSVGLVGVK